VIANAWPTCSKSAAAVVEVVVFHGFWHGLPKAGNADMKKRRLSMKFLYN